MSETAPIDYLSLMTDEFVSVNDLTALAGKEPRSLTGVATACSRLATSGGAEWKVIGGKSCYRRLPPPLEDRK